MPLGTVVTVDGSVTTPSGAFESSTFDKGFGLQDRGAGIYVSVAVDPHLLPRTQVRVTGELRDSGLRSQFDTHYEILPRFPSDLG